MARIRTIKPEFWTDEKVVELEPWERLLFIGLWNFADDQGFITYSPKRIKMQVFPADDFDVSRGLQRLLEGSMLEAFTLASSPGTVVLRIKGWKAHQKVSNPALPKYDPADLQECDELPGISRALASPLEPYPAEGKGKEGKGKETPSPPVVLTGLVTPNGATASAPRSKLDDLFDKFWIAYPRKVGKDDARRSWDKARRRTDPDVITAGAERLAADPNLPDKQFIPHPATWLARGGWDDEPCPEPTPGNTRPVTPVPGQSAWDRKVTNG